MLWDTDSGRRVAAFPHPGPGPGTHGVRLGFTRDGGTLVIPTGEAPGFASPEPELMRRDHLLLADARTGAATAIVPSGVAVPPPAGQAGDLALSPSSDHAAADFGNGFRNGNRVVVYDMRPNGEWRARPAFVVPSVTLAGLAFAPNWPPRLAVFRFLPPADAAATSPPIVDLRDLNGKVIWSVPLEMNSAGQSFAWGGPGDGRLFVGAGGNGDPLRVQDSDRVTALNARTGARLWTARWEASAGVDGLAVSPDGTLVAAANGGRLGTRVLRAEDGVTLASLPGLGEPRGVAWSPDGMRLAVNDGGRVRIFAILPNPTP